MHLLVMMHCHFLGKLFGNANSSTNQDNAKHAHMYQYSNLSKINKYTLTPVNAVWFVVISSIALNCVAIGSTQTATAIFSITAPALDLSYVSVIFAHQLYKDKVRFVEGPFSLGKWGRPINLVSVTWVVFISTVLFFPQKVPVTAANM